MIKEDTQLVLVDEWSADTIQSDFAKTILQGGWMVTAVKHEAPRCVMNNNPFYHHPEDIGKDTGMRQEDAEESISPRVQSPSRWVMNNDLYLANVCQLLQYQFYWKEHTNAHVLSFEARKHTKKKKVFGQNPIR